jgi:enoyl-CoA hydratase
MAWEYVSITRTPPIALVHFDRKANLNAFNQQLIDELTEAALSFYDDLDVHYVVLAGSDKAFSAGADLKAGLFADMEADSDPVRQDLIIRRRFQSGGRLCKAWEEMPQINIAAMERMSIGGGVALALACDWRVMGRGAFLYVPEVRLGLNLQWGTIPRLVTLVGPAKTKRITLMCERIDAATSLDWGLVDELADDGKTVAAAMEMARKTSEMPATAVRLMKEAINATANALHRASSFADADQSQLTGGFASSKAARKTALKT